MFPLLIGAAGLASAGFLGYHSIAPRSQFFGATFIGTPGRGRQLALTYDDGPNDPDTLLLLDVLERHQVKATFFLIGRYVEKRPDIVRRIVDAGHEIGNHTYSHPNLALISQANQIEELSRYEAALNTARLYVPAADVNPNFRLTTEASKWPSATIEQRVAVCQQLRQGNGTTLFRPPFGARRSATLRVARQLGYVPVQWTVTCFDWKQTTSARVEHHAIRQIRGGDVILMHDGGHKHFGADRRHTIEATDHIIAKYKNEGYEFVAVTEMMGAAAGSAVRSF